MPQATITGYWLSPALSNSLGRFVSGSSYWGTLTWSEETYNDGSYVTVDILKSSDDSVLVSGLTWNPNGYDLSLYSAIGTNNIKIKVNFYVVTQSPLVYDVKIDFKTAW